MEPQPHGSLGPQERWLFGPGQAYDLPGLWLDESPSLSCLAEFPNPVGNPLRALTHMLTQDGITMAPRLPILWKGGNFRPRFLPLFLQPQGPAPLSSQTPPQLAAALSLLAPDARHLRLNFPIRSETINPGTAEAQAMGPGAPGAPVVLAVIDHGIGFADARLKGRLDYCWSQSALAKPGATVPFGQEFTRDSIAAARAQMDEEEIYRQAGLLGGAGRPPMPLARKVAHGAHVLGTAAQGGPAEVRLIAVDLPATALWDTSGFGTDMFILAAMHYIFDRADRIARAHGLAAVPVVVNVSLGWSGGPQDGSSPIEAALAEIVSHRRSLAPTHLVLPSGNMFQARLSARITDGHFHQGQAAITWFAPPCDMTSSFAEVWLPGPPTGYEVSLTSPKGEETRISQAGWVDVVSGGRVVGLAALDRPRGLRWRVSFCLAPTEPKAGSPPGHGAAPAGEWRIAIRRPPTARGVVEVRIQRDEDHQQGKTGARQSHLRDPAHLPFDATGALAEDDSGAMLVRFGTLNGLATQAVSLNVGGVVGTTGRAARYSSAGVVGGRGVDVSAPSDRGDLLGGILSWGTRSGAVSAQSGTSSAAPAVARALAEALLTAPAGGADPMTLLAPVSLPVAGMGPQGVPRLGQRRLGG